MCLLALCLEEATFALLVSSSFQEEGQARTRPSERTNVVRVREVDTFSCCFRRNERVQSSLMPINRSRTASQRVDMALAISDS